MSPRSSRRRLVVAGLVAGLAMGAAVGATSLTGASSGDPPGVRPVVLHLARVVADPGADMELTAGLYCPRPAGSACDVRRAVAHVLSAGSEGWTAVPGVDDGPGYRFVVPGALVDEDGLSYWLELTTEGGDAVRIPEGGAASPFLVLTTGGLSEARWPDGSVWTNLRKSDGAVVRLGFGEGHMQVGRIGGAGDAAPLGPSSFDVAPDGSIYVADWVNARVLVLSPRGAHRRTVPLPIRRPVDLAVGVGDGLAVTTLGLGATAFELASDGMVVGRYPVGAGIAERIALTPGGPHVWVGPSQWAPMRSMPGVPLPAAAQSRALAPAVPGRDGTVALSEDLTGGRVAFVWARPDGSRAGSVLQLPTGVEPGVDYFVRGVPDGGAVAARGIWAEGREAVALLRFAADGSLTSASFIEAPSHDVDAAASAVRFRAPDEVLAIYTEAAGVRIDRFEVRSR